MQTSKHQTPVSDSGSQGAVNHPSAADWMEFLYREMPAQRRRELGAHLSECAVCTAQVKSWRAGMLGLDEWELPAVRPAWAWQWRPVLKWAAAAAVVLCVGFFAGRQTSNAASEIASLKSSVAQLTEAVEQAREVSALNVAARAEDRQATALALREVESRLGRLRAELETVAVNTEDSFQQTQQGLADVASLAISDGAKPAQNP